MKEMRDYLLIGIAALSLLVAVYVSFKYALLISKVESSHDEFRIGDRVHKCFVTQELTIR